MLINFFSRVHVRRNSHAQPLRKGHELRCTGARADQLIAIYRTCIKAAKMRQFAVAERADYPQW